jgi:hypothetical protein
MKFRFDKAWTEEQLMKEIHPHLSQSNTHSQSRDSHDLCSLNYTEILIYQTTTDE